MTAVTNLRILDAAIICVALIGLSVAFTQYDAQTESVFYVTTLVISTLFYISTASIARKLSERNPRFWNARVSDRVAKVVINTVAALWLCAAAFLSFIVVSATHSRWAIVFGIALVVLAVAVGRLLRRYFRTRSLMPYAISALVAVLIGLGVLIVVAN